MYIVNTLQRTVTGHPWKPSPLGSSWQTPFLCVLGSITQIASRNPPTNGEKLGSNATALRPGVATSSPGPTCFPLARPPSQPACCEKHTTHLLDEVELPSQRGPVRSARLSLLPARGGLLALNVPSLLWLPSCITPSGVSALTFSPLPLHVCRLLLQESA